MDKLRIVLSVVKKYQFWVLGGTLVLISLVCWWLATAGLAAQFQTRQSKIEGAFKSAIIQPNHPNENVIKNIKEQHEALKRGVFNAWTVLYEEQKEKNRFPVEALGEEFQKKFENLKFPKEELDRPYRETYQNYIKRHLPKLRARIDARRPKEEKEETPAGGGHPAGRDAPPGAGLGAGGPMAGGAARAAGGGFGGEVEWVGVVDWDENGDYARLVSRFDWQEAPSTLAVLLAQEDLWVYEALLQVIRNTNEGATNQANAAVKRIESLDIGRDAAAAWRDSEAAVISSKPGAGAMTGGPDAAMGQPGMMPGGGGMLPGGGGMMPGGGGMMPGAGGMGAGGAATGSADSALVGYRYVDNNWQPLAATEAEYPYAKHPYAEFKMMPIRMSLIMDQRRLPRFLVECGNSNMPIEVRRVRILKTQVAPQDLASPAAGAAGGGMLPGGMGAPGGLPTRPAGGFGAGGGGLGGLGGGYGQAMGAPGQENTAYDIPVEIHAVIYIYLPPDFEKLGTGAAAAGPEAAPVAGTPAAAPPVAPPAAPPATPSPSPAVPPR
jgi:hypothetical protein